MPEPIICIVCNRHYAQIYDHWRKNHPNRRGTEAEFAQMGFIPCERCSKAFTSHHGVKTHQAKGRCIGTQAITPARTPYTPVNQGQPSTRQIQTEPPIRRFTTPRPPPIAIDPMTTPSRRRRASRTPSPARERALPRLRQENDKNDKNGKNSSDNINSSDFESDVELTPMQTPRQPTYELLGEPSTPRDREETPLPPRTPLPNILLTNDINEQEETPYRPILASLPIYDSDDPPTSPIPPRVYGDEHTPPPKGYPSLINKNDDSSTYRPQDIALQTLFSYNGVTAIDPRQCGRHMTLLANTAARIARKFNQNPTEQNLLDFLLLPKAGLALGIRNGTLGVKHVLQHYPETRIPPPTPLEDKGGDPPPSNFSPTSRAQKLIERGFLSRAARALADPTTLARNSEEIVEILKEKHPLGNIFSFSTTANPRIGAVPTKDDITQALATFSSDTAPGISGWTVPLLREAIKRDDVLKFLTYLCRTFQLGTTPGRHLLTTSRLVALDKADGGVRPIAVGELIYRLMAKVALTKSFQREQLAPFQLGVRSPGGTEPIIHLLDNALHGRLNSYRHLVTLDFKNAFNSIDRRYLATGILRHAPEFFKLARWAYSSSSALVMYDNTTLQSSEGVRQGDPLGPLFFSLGIRSTLEKLVEDLSRIQDADDPPPIILAYLDDIYILTKEKTCIETIQNLLYKAPIQLNAKKSASYDLDEIRQEGIQILGSFIGPTTKKKAFLEAKIDELRQISRKLLDLPKQHALLLLRSSTSSLLRHLPRTLGIDGLQSSYEAIDKMIIQLIRSLKSPNKPKPTDIDLISLPTRLGGLGIQLYAETAHLSYIASRELAMKTIATILGQSNNKNSTSLPRDNTIEEGPHLPTYRQQIDDLHKQKLERLRTQLDQNQKNALEENAAYLGRRWTTTLPTTTPLVLDDVDLAAALSIRLLTPPNDQRGLCKDCGLEYSYGHDDLCKAKHRQTITKHDLVCRALYSAIKRIPQVKVQLEPSENQQNQGNARRTDLRVDTLKGTTHYDITIVSLGAKSIYKDANATLLAAEKAKQTKYQALGQNFKPIVISQGGLLGKTTSSTYKDIQQSLTHSGALFLDQYLSISLARIRARTWTGFNIV